MKPSMKKLWEEVRLANKQKPSDKAMGEEKEEKEVRKIIGIARIAIRRALRE